MNTNEAAALANTTPATIRRWINTNKIVATKANGRWFVSETSLRTHLGLQNEIEETTPVATPAPVADAEQIIRAAYWKLARYAQDWVLITRLRAELAGLDRETVDATLVRMERRDLHLVPEADQKLLTEADRAAAVLIGGTPKHLVALEG